MGGFYKDSEHYGAVSSALIDKVIAVTKVGEASAYASFSHLCLVYRIEWKSHTVLMAKSVLPLSGRSSLVLFCKTQEENARLLR